MKIESKIDLKNVVDSISEAVIEVVKEQNEYLVSWSNKRADEIFAKNLLGLNIDEVFLEDEWKLLLDMYKLNDASKEKIVTLNNRVFQVSFIEGVNTEETIQLMLLDITQYEDFKNNLQNTINEKTQTLEIMNDLLEEGMRKGLEENRKIISQLHKKEKLASMGELISNLAHHWRQPLSVITSASTGMIVQQQLELLNIEILEESCKRINDHAQFLSKTIEDFSSFVNTDEDERAFDLNDSLREVLILLDPLVAKSKINIIQEFEPNLLLVSYYTDMIQALKNIIKNSLDAFIKNDILEPCIYISAYQDKSTIYLGIKDNGGGVSYIQPISATFVKVRIKG